MWLRSRAKRRIRKAEGEKRVEIRSGFQNRGSALRTGWSKRFGVLLLFLSGVLLIGFPVAKARQSSESAPPGNAQRGKKLFLADGCYECHGREGQGAAQTGATRIGPPQLSFEGFQNYVRSPKNEMPPYAAKALPDLDLADIYAFLKTIPMPPKGKDIPLLNK